MCFGRQPSGHLLCSPEPSSIHLQITARLSILNEHLQRPRLLVEAQGPTYQPAARRSSKGLWDPSPPASTLHCHAKHTTRQRELPLSHGAGSPRITSGPRDPGTGEGGGKLLCSHGCPAELNSCMAGLRTATPYKRHDGSTCHVLPPSPLPSRCRGSFMQSAFQGRNVVAARRVLECQPVCLRYDPPVPPASTSSFPFQVAFFSVSRDNKECLISRDSTFFRAA